MISIIVLIYNNELSDIFLTLDSILIQSFKDYEIIVADDNSHTNYTEDIKKYFVKKDFNNYAILCNSQNLGTVKNYLNALKIASGEYIKPISPGDLLYEKNTLKKMNDFIVSTHCIFGFGKMFSYVKGENGYKEFKSPLDLSPYYNNQVNKIKKNIVLYGDFISGASMFARKENLIYELTFLSEKGKVKYCEDYVQIQLILKDIRFDFFDEPVVLYENSQGISTKNYAATEKSKVQIDYENYISILNERYSNILLKKRYKLNCYNNLSKYKKVICKFVTAPGLYWFRFKQREI